VSIAFEIEEGDVAVSDMSDAGRPAFVSKSLVAPVSSMCAEPIAMVLVPFF
jgi:hypothetical protein